MADQPADGLRFDDAFLRRLEAMSLRARRVAGAPAGGRRGRRQTPAADFIDHRPYSPGDDQRHIDWNAVARHDEVLVKVGRAPQAAEVHMLVDVSPSMALAPAKHRLARELAAALGWLSLAAGDRVTVTPFPTPEGVAPWGPAAGTARGAALLRYLAGLPAAEAPATALGPVVRSVARAVPTGGLMVVISDLWVSDDLDVALAVAPPPRWEALVLHVLDRTELDPESFGAAELEDAESGRMLRLIVDDELADRYRAALNGRLERLRSIVGGRGARYALVPADWPLERAVIPHLRRRGILEA